MKKFRVAAAALLLLACHEPTDPDRPGPSYQSASTQATRWVVVFNQPNDLPRNVDRMVADAGGIVTARLPQIGAIGATSSDANFAVKLAADPQVKAVSEDIEVQMIPSGASVEPLEVNARESDGMQGPAEPTGPDPQLFPTEPLYREQWDKMRMNASPTGSYAVQRGRRDVVVAILDTGVEVFPAAHPDIAPNLDYARSRSFVTPAGSPELGPADGDPNPAQWDDKHGHGSWCASAVAAPINNFGIAGVAPQVTLVALKVLRDTGSGSYLWLAQALVYAGINKFDVASMSLGGYLRHAGNQALITIVQRAVDFARSNGVTPVAALGNDNFDLSDGNFVYDFIDVPGELPGVIGVSATGYTDRKAFYSNYGVGKTDISAPGGGSTTFEAMPTLPPEVPGGPRVPVYRGNGRVLGAWSAENLGGVTPVFREEECDPVQGSPCYYYAWVRGTSMATPNAAGVVALIISQYGDFTPDNSQKLHASPTYIESILQQTANNRPCVDNLESIYYNPNPNPMLAYDYRADCSGTAGGYTDFFGKGIVDAFKAVTSQQ